MRSRRLWLLVALFLLAAAGALWIAPELAPAQQPKTPRLAVILVFDQMRGDYLERWQALFGPGGFKRLQEEGAWFTNCHYPYAYTLTAPGHTSLVTGCSPDKHGIIANDWLDRASRESIASVTPPPEEAHLGLGPYRRRQESIGDVLLRVLAGRGRVFSFSIKDRAAILLAALRAQACYWVDPKTGLFMTSRYYRPEPHSWATAFNAGKGVDRWLGATWERFVPGLDYVRYSGPDDVAAEGIGYLQGRTFPHSFPAERSEIYYEAVATSPQGSELLLEFTKTAFDAERIGRTEATDLVCLSFSSNDLVGHCWGPDSQEVLDVTLRTDALLKTLFDLLDARVGKGNYVVALSADHGVCPLPEVAAAQGKETGRVPPELLTTLAEEQLNKVFLPGGAKAPWLERPKKSNPWIYLNQATLREQKVEPAAAEQALARWLATQPGIEAAFTRSDIMSPQPLGPLGETMRRSFRPESSGDVMAVLKPYHLFAPPLSSLNPKYNAFRTTHGTPHPYDTHVPLLAMGPGIEPGKRAEAVTPQALASIIAEALALPAPQGAEAAVPAGLFRR